MLKNSRGNAMIEIIPMLAIFILLVNFSLGFFGLIHSGIMNSIAARNYAFETFRNRADLRYLRDTDDSEAGFTYAKSGLRWHTIVTEGNSNINEFVATKRPIKFSDISAVETPLGLGEHTKVLKVSEQKTASSFVTEGVSPGWVRSAYGICLETKCGQ